MRERKFVQMVLVMGPRWPPYMVNPLKILFSRTRKPMTLGLGMKHWGCEAYQACANDDFRLTLTYLTSRSNFIPNEFRWVFFLKI